MFILFFATVSSRTSCSWVILVQGVLDGYFSYKVFVKGSSRRPNRQVDNLNTVLEKTVRNFEPL